MLQWYQLSCLTTLTVLAASPVGVRNSNHDPVKDHVDVPARVVTLWGGEEGCSFNTYPPGEPQL
jgi:hypothetical protein